MTITITDQHDHRLTLAIDPGTAQMGVAVFDGATLLDGFTVRGSKKIKDPDVRFFQMLGELEEHLETALFCDHCGHSHLKLVYEDPQFLKFAGKSRPIEPLYRAVGSLSYWGRSKGMGVYRYKVAIIKAGISGRIGASKSEIERIVKEIIPGCGGNETDDVYDAMSIGMFHLDQQVPGCFGVTLPYDSPSSTMT
jgi:Holliday junction resolvasome RuvABC endonuclease subunit